MCLLVIDLSKNKEVHGSFYLTEQHAQTVIELESNFIYTHHGAYF